MRTRVMTRPNLRPATTLAALLALLVPLLLTVGAGPAAAAGPDVDPRPRTAAELAGEQLVFDQHNQARQNPARFGYPDETPVPPLVWDEHLAQVARQWSDIMARDAWMRHNPHRDEPQQAPGTGENVAHSGWGTRNIGAAGLTQMWMDSTGHRDNIMFDAYASVGIGLSIDHRGEVWATVVFLPAPAPAPPEHVPPPEYVPPPAPQTRDLSKLCPSVDRSRFTDVTRHVTAVECLADLGITTGFTPTTFEPNRTVTRGQMAVFIDRVATLAGQPFPDGPTGTFPDVGDGYYAPAVGRLVQAGIVNGFTDGTYRPNRPVTRDQMAYFLVTVHDHLQGARTLGPRRSWFADNHSDRAFDRYVNLAADLGLAAGNNGRFEHRSPVRRDHMALFLLRLVAAQDDPGWEQQWP